MSDVTTGSVFNPHFFMNPPWWIGRVESKDVFKDNIQPSTFDGLHELKGWGERYNVRIFNWHTGDIDKLPPENTVKAQVVRPVTAGSGHGGASQTSSIQSGSIVFGFFMDGMAGQEPYIVGVIGNSNNNVPRERGAAAPNQPATTLAQPATTTPATTPTATGTTTTPAATTPQTTTPPTPVSGPGSAANLPVPPNVDQLSIEQLKKLLDPSKTPSATVFAAASKARELATLQKLSPQEIERQVLIATVKASREPGAVATSGNCNPGYQQFNDTYSDSNLGEARVPDNLIVGGFILSDITALHIDTLAWQIQDEDKNRQQALANPCREESSDLKGIDLTIKNLILDIEKIKKITNDATSYISQAQSLIDSASGVVTMYMKNIMASVRAYVMEKVVDQAKKIFPFLFPSETNQFSNLLNTSINAISCAFNKLIAMLLPKITDLLNNLIGKVINGQSCTSSNLISDILNGTLIDQIGSIIDKALTPISSFISSIAGIASNLSGSLFQALDFISGILSFFTCDETRSCPTYSQISLAGEATPGENMSFSGIASNIDGLPAAAKMFGVDNLGSTSAQSGPNNFNTALYTGISP